MVRSLHPLLLCSLCTPPIRESYSTLQSTWTSWMQWYNYACVQCWRCMYIYIYIYVAAAGELVNMTFFPTSAHLYKYRHCAITRCTSFVVHKEYMYFCSPKYIHTVKRTFWVHIPTAPTASDCALCSNTMQWKCSRNMCSKDKTSSLLEVTHTHLQDIQTGLSSTWLYLLNLHSFLATLGGQCLLDQCSFDTHVNPISQVSAIRR